MRAFSKHLFRARSQREMKGLAEVEECKWSEFFKDPSVWWDNRKNKINPKQADFVHAATKECLWISSYFKPSWVSKQLNLLNDATWDATKSMRVSYKKNEDGLRLDVDESTSEDQESKSDPSTSKDDDANLYYRIKQHRRALKACKSVKEVRKIHAELAKNKDSRHLEVAKTLIAIYSKLGAMAEARRIFDKLQEPTQGSWNAMVRGYSAAGEKELSLGFFARMLEAEIVPDARLFVRAFKACGDLAAEESGKIVQGKVVKEISLKRAIALHRQAEECGQESNIFVANAVLDVYAKCGSMAIARKVFERMAFQDPVSWNTIILGYVRNGESATALDLFARMQAEEFVPNARTFLAAVSACTKMAIKERSRSRIRAILERGRAIHEQIRGTKFRDDGFLANALLDMYAKCGSMADARSVFDGIQRRTLVSWNAILLGYGHNSQPGAAIELFEKMGDEAKDLVPNARTYAAVLLACSGLAARDAKKKSKLAAALERCRGFHSAIKERGLGSDPFVAAGLVELYAKCGSVQEAREVFDNCGQRRDPALWSAMILGYAQQGEASSALELFSRMELQQDQAPAPDARSYAAAITACSCAAPALSEGDEKAKREEFLARGRGLHSKVAKAGFEDELLVASSLLEMYAKLGSVAEARKIFERIGERSSAQWSAMVAAYARVGDDETVLEFFRRMKGSGIAPDGETFVAALEACGKKKDLEIAQRIRDEIAKAGMEKHSAIVEFYKRAKI